VRSGEKAAVLAVLHVFAVGFEHARVRTGLRENFSPIIACIAPAPRAIADQIVFALQGRLEGGYVV
jgi:hypothetical protein